jgi:hypothetical protein
MISRAIQNCSNSDKITTAGVEMQLYDKADDNYLYDTIFSIPMKQRKNL